MSDTDAREEEDHLERLKLMVEDHGQTWDLSENDQKAIAWALGKIAAAESQRRQVPSEQYESLHWENVGYEVNQKVYGYRSAHNGDGPNNFEMAEIVKRALRVSSHILSAGPQAPSEQKWIRQGACSECDNDGCAKCDPVGTIRKICSGDIQVGDDAEDALKSIADIVDAMSESEIPLAGAQAQAAQKRYMASVNSTTSTDPIRWRDVEPKLFAALKALGAPVAALEGKP